MTNNQFESWKKSRVQGKLKFVLLRGVLSWGIPMFIFMTFIINKPEAGFTSQFIVVNALIWAIAGAVFGLIVWYFGESSFHKELAKRNNI
ncbi:hypothetical protein D5R81_17080 [Parashewanella spongiae]|uniref:DUF485 domain-containing protein n=1 Tax=Parashewanella spongiae TaxID=342950 RepID=A0A3A6TFH7_9GAMM|nr:hypothetical protein [Parashewanella spongiae]MCL1079842.1 hypothetical protein [Parashewanella spongiae]RJY06839.1 hypothetical protein D5R81_17080 [Parashewanella spongiae]